MQRRHIIPATDAASINEHIRYRPTAGIVAQETLQLLAQCVVIQLHHIRRRDNRVLIQEDRLGPFTERTVRLGKDNDCNQSSVSNRLSFCKSAYQSGMHSLGARFKILFNSALASL